ncbi:hypothetical protein P280DRAFT_547732 [Massarina eburnea CBS 473.64]|uniref:Zn(2)-C6 fungal-type domain-containing protein n=1 Tax=Massarina eburnea CBS 473.64 TaxID=1395130 RepID=A0A6A6S780_9PLEO|nr:hypothetical protein P280DRAFT_547732 [Massarina eburnea CBS 473.64]
MDDTTPPSLAQRTCLQCKASKKRCDKLIPKCSRCSRLVTFCAYNNEHERPEVQQTDTVTASESADSRFDDVFQRLQRLEAQVFQTGANNASIQNTPSQDSVMIENEEQSQAPQTGSPRTVDPESWALNPGHLRIRHMSMILLSSLMRILKENNTTMPAVAQLYFGQTHKWLPIIWQAKFERQVAAFNVIDDTDGFLLQMLAMHLLVTPIDAEKLKRPEECPWYRTCKYHFAQYVALAEPRIELVQVGMLIALHEYLQDMERALTTLGVAIRIAFDLGLDEIVARQANCSPGEMKPEDEEVVLTWWGLSRLERYFNMPPNPFPKHPSMPFQEFTAGINNGYQHNGPPITEFSTIDSDTLDFSVTELEAARRLGRVQSFIRENHRRPLQSLCAGFDTLLREIQEHIVMLRLRMRTTQSWAGLGVNLAAALQLQLFFSEKHNSMDDETLQRLHSIITQICDVLGQCRLINGFTENYMEGIQPTWFSIPFQVLRAAKMIKERDVERKMPDVDLTMCFELLSSMEKRYKLAASSTSMNGTKNNTVFT